jgi:SAM-dependent methyltransferase
MSLFCAVAFNVAADAYDRFMGRYSAVLTPQMVDFAGVEAGQRVLDVGCGPGALVAELIRRGAHVSAVDPSAPFVAAVRERYPDVDARQAAAEELPFEDGSFDAALAQLVVHFMADPVNGISEMARVTGDAGIVAASVWDMVGGKAPISPFWRTARELDPAVEGEARRAGAGEGQLSELFAQAGLTDIEETALRVDVEHDTFDAWWEPFKLGVGPAGEYYNKLDRDRQQVLEQRLREQLGEPIALETGDMSRDSPGTCPHVATPSSGRLRPRRARHRSRCRGSRSAP